MTGPGKILVCGTNAYKPRCRYYHLSANGHYTQLGAEKTGQGICPYDPRHNSTSAYVGKYSAVEVVEHNINEVVVVPREVGKYHEWCTITIIPLAFHLSLHCVMQ